MEIHKLWAIRNFISEIRKNYDKFIYLVYLEHKLWAIKQVQNLV